MKFSEFDGQRWGELQPYFDTCILPVTGLTGEESPAEATERLEALRDLLDLVELPFKGRTVTYPAMHYVSGPSGAERVEETLVMLKRNGFRHTIVASLASELRTEDSLADYWLMPEPGGGLPTPHAVSAEVQAMWRRPQEDKP